MEDLLARGRRVWMMDAKLEKFVARGKTVGARLFDTGSFHFVLCGVEVPDEETTGLCVKARESGRATPFRHSIAAQLYGDHVSPSFSPEAMEEAVQVLVDRMAKARVSGSGELLGFEATPRE